MRTIKVKPIIIVFISCLIIFTAVWFGYQYFGVQQPLSSKLQNANHSIVQIDISNAEKSLDVNVALKEGATLDTAISELKAIIQDSKFSTYNVNYKIESTSSTDLDQIWSASLFQIADIMANKNYSQIPSFLEQITSENTNLAAYSAIDEKYVYISLMQDQAVKHILLPLEAGSMEVWNYE